MKETKEFRVTLGQCLETLSQLGNLYESIATGEDDNGFRIRADEAAAAMRASVIFLVDFCSERRWISLKERVPVDIPHGYCLVTDGEEVDTANYDKAANKFRYCIDRDYWEPTHWMPLPEPPQP